jgi:hypothetical protein
MFIYRSRFLTRGEVWFDEKPDGARVDWIYYRQRSSPLATGRSKPFYTWLIDLRKSPEGIFAEIEDRTARKITEAQMEERLHCEHCDANDPRILDDVEAMWNHFAAAHHTPALERAWLGPLKEAGALDIVAAKDAAGNVLGYHLVFLTLKRARQILAISPYKSAPTVAWRKAVSCANCLIHWHNFLAFSERGIYEFDFGGWHPGRTDIRLLGINRFKESFGGRMVREYDCDKPVTLKGRLLLTLAHVVAKLRRTVPISSAETKHPHREKSFAERQASPALQ